MDVGYKHADALPLASPVPSTCSRSRSSLHLRRSPWSSARRRQRRSGGSVSRGVLVCLCVAHSVGGGSGWTGPTTCAVSLPWTSSSQAELTFVLQSGSVCTVSNQWYSQCLPGTTTATPTTTTPPTTTVPPTTTGSIQGSVRWMAIELFQDEKHGDESVKHTVSSDVWALGMTFVVRSV